MMWLGFLATIRRLIKAIIFAQYIEDTGREREIEGESDWGRQTKREQLIIIDLRGVCLICVCATVCRGVSIDKLSKWKY